MSPQDPCKPGAAGSVLGSQWELVPPPRALWFHLCSTEAVDSWLELKVTPAFTLSAPVTVGSVPRQLKLHLQSRERGQQHVVVAKQQMAMGRANLQPFC